MTDTAHRDAVLRAWQQWHIIERKRRGGFDWEQCREHPSTWDWQEYTYRDAGASPVVDLFLEYEQCCRDGEAAIFSQAKLGAILEWLAR